MNDFISKLDALYEKQRKKNMIPNFNHVYSIFCDLKVYIYGKEYKDFFVKKEKITRYMYQNGGCRIYLTDADILTMLLQIEDKNTINALLEGLQQLYQGAEEKYKIKIDGNLYEVIGIPEVKDNQILFNRMDVDMSFEMLLVLINLVLSKDVASNEVWKKKKDFVKKDFMKYTLMKYILLLKYYYFHDEIAYNYLVSLGYNIKQDIYCNYDTWQKREEKYNYFSDFDKFEKCGII